MNSSDVLQFIREHWSQLIQSAQILDFKPGQVIFYQHHMPSGIFILHKGRVAYSKEEDGAFKEVLGSECQPIIGLDFLLSNTPYAYTSRAVEPTKICYVSKSEILSWRNDALN